MKTILGLAVFLRSLKGLVVITLYSYPQLSGVARNNPVTAYWRVLPFLKLACMPAFTQEHVFNASSAPRGRLHYGVWWRDDR